MNCTSDASFLEETESDANTNSSFPIGWFEHSSSSLSRVYALLLVKTNENHVFLMYFHIWKLSAPGPPSTDWTTMDLKMTDIAFCSDFWLLTPQ
jgi:hypothetical protein